ncbi:MAG: uracil-DNA glycosylase [Clostridia bacterium]|nr:uracil-DNA glycosylase [Clostridia bacterium]
MLKERYILEAEKIRYLDLEHDADLDHPVFGEGRENNPVIMFIGEAPGREEAASGRPFVGKAGKQLDSMLSLAGIDRAMVYVTNAVKYRPIKRKGSSVSNRTPTAAEVRGGLSLLRAEIEAVDPDVIATLGNVPLSAVVQLAGGVNEPLTVGAAHGFPVMFLISGKPRRVFPLYHPAASIYNRELKPVLEKDLVMLGEYARSIDNE